MRRWYFFVLTGALLTFPLLTGCPKSEPPPPPTAAPGIPIPTVPAAKTGKAPAGPAVKGASLNKFFPDKGPEGAKVTFTQEKAGFAQAEVGQGGKAVATLSIADTNANPSARDKFYTSSKEVMGYPVIPVGDKGTAMLVGGRYQVQVRSMASSFGPDNREAYLALFDLKGLEKLK